jgi:hypothetical protein
VKNDEIFYGNVKSCLFTNDLYKLLYYILEIYHTKNMLSFKKVLQILKLYPYLFKLMDFIFPYKHFNNTIIRNTTYLMDLFTKLYLAKINFKVIVENNEFPFIPSKE